MNGVRLLNGVFKKVAIINDELLHIWISHIVFSWRWFLSLTLTILPWIVWIKIRDKKNTVKLLFVGLIVIIILALYNMIHWKYLYSFIIYVPIYLILNHIYKSKLLDIKSNT